MFLIINGKKFKQREVEIFLKTNDELDEYEYWINKIYFPISVQKYNQIVGYLQILIENKDRIFELFLTEDKNNHFNGKFKHFIVYSN